MSVDVAAGDHIANMSQIKHLGAMTTQSQRRRWVAGSAIWYKLVKPRRPTIGELGRLVIRWNDLEIQVRSLLVTLTADITSAEILTADLETVAMFNAVRALAIQYDARRRRLNIRIKIDADNTNTKPKLYDEAAAHINHLIDCADRLHDYKELFVRRTNSIQKSKYITTEASKINIFNKWRLPSNLGYDLAQLTTQLVTLRKYAAALTRCIIKNENRMARTQVVWPKEFPLPTRLPPHLTKLKT